MRCLPILLFALLALSAQAQERLPAAVLNALKSAGIPPQSVAVVVQPIGAAKPALNHQAGAPMNPASLMKLVTTFAALELLGPAFTWRTEVLATSPVENGILNGDLILRGSGDPRLTYDRLWLLLRELRGRGLMEIRGDLVLDRTAFSLPEHDPAGFDAKPLRPYNVGADALLFNFATLHLTLVPPENNGGSIRLLAEPLPAGFNVINRLRPTEAKACGDWRENLSAQFAPGQLTLSGDFPRICGEKRWHLAGLPNATLLHGVFTRLWRELGGEFAGRVKDGATPTNATLLADSESPALGELVRDINKYSNNVMAQQVFLTLGKKVGAGGTAQAGSADNIETAAAERNIRNWLAQKQLDFPELILESGSGLSRRQRISAASLARLLDAAWRSPVMPELFASLPIVAADGTTKKRYNGVRYAGQAHLKTGSLEGVRGIAGTLLDRQGRRHIVVFMVNHPNAAQAQAAFDALLETIWNGNTPP